MVVGFEPTRSLILGLQRYTFKDNFKIKFQKNIMMEFHCHQTLPAPNKNGLIALLFVKTIRLYLYKKQ
jgi:hypothetical protein